MIAWGNLRSLATHSAHSEESDQTDPVLVKRVLIIQACIGNELAHQRSLTIAFIIRKHNKWKYRQLQIKSIWRNWKAAHAYLKIYWTHKGPLARSDVCPPGNHTFTGSIPGLSHSFVEIWSWNYFYGHSLPTTDSSRAVVSCWRNRMCT